MEVLLKELEDFKKERKLADDRVEALLKESRSQWSSCDKCGRCLIDHVHVDCYDKYVCNRCEGDAIEDLAPRIKMAEEELRLAYVAVDSARYDVVAKMVFEKACIETIYDFVEREKD